MSSRCSIATSRDASSRRTFAQARSSSFTSTRSGCLRPTSSGTSVRSPSTSSSWRKCAPELPAVEGCRTRSRAGAVGWWGSRGAAACSTANGVIAPAASVSIAGRRVLTPAVSSQSLLQEVSSRPRSSRARREILQFRVAVLVLLEVGGNTLHEVVEPDPRDELLEDRAALGVRDAVEVDLNVLEVVDRARRPDALTAAGPGGTPRSSPSPGTSSTPHSTRWPRRSRSWTLTPRSSR